LRYEGKQDMSKTESQSPNPVSSPANSPTIAIIGCGAIAESRYLPALIKHPSVSRNLILVDRNEARAQKLALEFDARSCLVDYRDLLGGKADGVIIATPSHLHHPMAIDFLADGVHVLCEKPLADSAEKAREMVDQAQAIGVTLSANYQRRLYASYLKAKELLANGTLGEPLSIQYYEGEVFRWPTVSGFYFDTGISSRGVLLDRGAHVLDLICWWLGGKPKITSSQNDSFGGREAVAHVRFEYGQCLGEVKLSLLGKFPCVFRIKCERGTIEGDVFDFRNLTLITKSGQRERLKLNTREKYHSDFGDTVVTNFLDVITQGTRPLVSGADVLDSIEWIDECYQAASRFNMPWYEIPRVDNGK
jgi:predicted dehydrogenase